MFIWQSTGVEEVDKVVLRLRYLFSDDPLVSAEPEIEAPGEEEPLSAKEEALEAEPRPARARNGLCSWFELEHDYDGFRFGLEDLTAQIR